MILELKYFGMIAEIIQKEEETIEFTQSDIKDLEELLKITYPKLLDMDYKMAVNQSLVDNNVVLKSNDEIALLPPFAGG